MKCILNGREVMYPCSANCPLYGDCVVTFQKETKPVTTNADRIRAMSDEELAEMLTTGKGNFDCFECHATPHECEVNCKEGCVVWLQQPAEEVDHE